VPTSAPQDRFFDHEGPWDGQGQRRQICQGDQASPGFTLGYEILVQSDITRRCKSKFLRLGLLEGWKEMAE
jgi:hypothetical protein